MFSMCILHALHSWSLLCVYKSATSSSLTRPYPDVAPKNRARHKFITETMTQRHSVRTLSVKKIHEKLVRLLFCPSLLPPQPPPARSTPSPGWPAGMASGRTAPVEPSGPRSLAHMPWLWQEPPQLLAWASPSSPAAWLCRSPRVRWAPGRGTWTSPPRGPFRWSPRGWRLLQRQQREQSPS